MKTYLRGGAADGASAEPSAEGDVTGYAGQCRPAITTKSWCNSRVVTTPVTSTRITSNTGRTAARRGSTISRCSVPITTRCCTKAASRSTTTNGTESTSDV